MMHHGPTPCMDTPPRTDTVHRVRTGLVGAIYQVLPPVANDGDLLRIADETTGEAGSEGGYLYLADFFEPVPSDELSELNLELETSKKEAPTGVRAS